jgi:hypothetical protein
MLAKALNASAVAGARVLTQIPDQNGEVPEIFLRDTIELNDLSIQNCNNIMTQYDLLNEDTQRMKVEDKRVMIARHIGVRTNAM